jgi:acyl dehydratase
MRKEGEAMPEDSELLSDEARSWIGLELEMKSEPITHRDVEEYLVASDDYHPLYTSDEAAREAGYERRLVPPLLYMHTVRQRIRQSELTADGSTKDRRPPVGNQQGVAGELEFEFIRPLYVGVSLAGKRRLASLEPKQGKRRSFVVCTWMTEYFDQHGNLVIRERNSQILY